LLRDRDFYTRIVAEAQEQAQAQLSFDSVSEQLADFFGAL
jgi:hypothetical protein